MNRLSLFVLLATSTLLASCGAWRKTPTDMALHTPPPRSNESIVLEALQAHFTANTTLLVTTKGGVDIKAATVNRHLASTDALSNAFRSIRVTRPYSAG